MATPKLTVLPGPVSNEDREFMVRQLREAIHDVEEGIVEGMALTLSKTNGSIANAFRVTGSRRGSKFMLMGALLDTLMRVNHDRCDV